jgi:hypothetical protein
MNGIVSPSLASSSFRGTPRVGLGGELVGTVEMEERGAGKRVEKEGRGRGGWEGERVEKEGRGRRKGKGRRRNWEEEMKDS